MIDSILYTFSFLFKPLWELELAIARLKDAVAPSVIANAYYDAISKDRVTFSNVMFSGSISFIQVELHI